MDAVTQERKTYCQPMLLGNLRDLTWLVSGRMMETAFLDLMNELRMNQARLLNMQAELDWRDAQVERIAAGLVFVVADPGVNP